MQFHDLLEKHGEADYTSRNRRLNPCQNHVRRHFPEIFSDPSPALLLSLPQDHCVCACDVHVNKQTGKQTSKNTRVCYFRCSLSHHACLSYAMFTEKSFCWCLTAFVCLCVVRGTTFLQLFFPLLPSPAYDANRERERESFGIEKVRKRVRMRG